LASNLSLADLSGIYPGFDFASEEWGQLDAELHAQLAGNSPLRRASAEQVCMNIYISRFMNVDLYIYRYIPTYRYRNRYRYVDIDMDIDMYI